MIDIIKQNRGLGSTYWLLRSAISNPRVAIISATAGHAKELKEEYREILLDMIPSKEVSRAIMDFTLDYPLFLSEQEAKKQIPGSNLPFVFDNYSILKFSEDKELETISRINTARDRQYNEFKNRVTQLLVDLDPAKPKNPLPAWDQRTIDYFNKL